MGLDLYYPRNVSMSFPTALQSAHSQKAKYFEHKGQIYETLPDGTYADIGKDAAEFVDAFSNTDLDRQIRELTTGFPDEPDFETTE